MPGTYSSLYKHQRLGFHQRPRLKAGAHSNFRCLFLVSLSRYNRLVQHFLATAICLIAKMRFLIIINAPSWKPMLLIVPCRKSLAALDPGLISVTVLRLPWPKLIQLSGWLPSWWWHLVRWYCCFEWSWCLSVLHCHCHCNISSCCWKYHPFGMSRNRQNYCRAWFLYCNERVHWYQKWSLTRCISFNYISFYPSTNAPGKPLTKSFSDLSGFLAQRWSVPLCFQNHWVPNLYPNWAWMLSTQGPGIKPRP